MASMHEKRRFPKLFYNPLTYIEKIVKCSKRVKSFFAPLSTKTFSIVTANMPEYKFQTNVKSDTLRVRT